MIFMHFDTFISKDEFRRRFGIPKSTFRKYIALAEDGMPKPYNRRQKMLSPAQAEYLATLICLD